MDKVDKWCAEQCDVELRPGKYGVMFYKGHPWSIKRADCREIVRERFKIRTEYYDKKWHCAYWDKPMSMAKVHSADKTIAEAEIACITAIYEARDE